MSKYFKIVNQNKECFILLSWQIYVQIDNIKKIGLAMIFI